MSFFLLSYHLVKGLFGSPYVGLANIQAFLDGTGLVRLLKNTLNINIFSIVIGAFYLFVAMKLLNILATDMGFMNNFYNPLTYEHLDTYSTYQFRSGMMQSNFSGYAAGYVVQLLIQLLPALIGMYIIASPFRRSQEKPTMPFALDTGASKETTYQAYDSGNRVYLPYMLFAVLPLTLLVLVWKAASVLV